MNLLFVTIGMREREESVSERIKQFSFDDGSGVEFRSHNTIERIFAFYEN